MISYKIIDNGKPNEKDVLYDWYINFPNKLEIKSFLDPSIREPTISLALLNMAYKRYEKDIPVSRPRKKPVLTTTGTTTTGNNNRHKQQEQQQQARQQQARQQQARQQQAQQLQQQAQLLQKETRRKHMEEHLVGKKRKKEEEEASGEEDEEERNIQMNDLDYRIKKIMLHRYIYNKLT